MSGQHLVALFVSLVAGGSVPVSAQVLDGAPSPGAASHGGFNFELKDHPQLTIGRSVELEFQGKFEIEHGIDPFAAENKLEFDTARRRIGVAGTLFDRVGFQLEREIVDDRPWRDAFVSFRATRSASVQAGRFKAPFSREQLTSSVRLDFVSRAAAPVALSPGRQVGVMTEGKLTQFVAFNRDSSAQIAKPRATCRCWPPESLPDPSEPAGRDCAISSSACPPPAAVFQRDWAVLTVVL
jgi:phosphate-selective porin